eukprot:2617568-Pyramimonas_sp.AAC.1
MVVENGCSLHSEDLNWNISGLCCSGEGFRAGFGGGERASRSVPRIVAKMPNPSLEEAAQLLA